MHKPTFGTLIRDARSGKHLSLRRLATLSGVDYSRLARIEQGSRPAPDLASIRTLARVLDLDLAELLVSAGTARSVVAELVWSERTRLGRRAPALGAYGPGDARLDARNTFVGTVEGRHGALCDVRVGPLVVRALSFSDARRLRLTVPPEAVLVTSDRPVGLPESAATTLAARVVKARPMGQLSSLVVASDEVEFNALFAADRGERHHRPGDSVFVTLLTATIRTEPLEEGPCEQSGSDS